MSAPRLMMPPLCPIMHLQWDTDWTLEFTSQSSACIFRPYPVEGCDSGGGEVCVAGVHHPWEWGVEETPLPVGTAGRGGLATCLTRKDQTSSSPLLPGWARRGGWHWPSWGSMGRQEKHSESCPSETVRLNCVPINMEKADPWRWGGM